MKKIQHITLLFTLFFPLFFGLLVTMSNPVSAQVKPDLLLAVIPYTPQQNLDFFFLNSVYPLSYLEVENETPVFISVITPEQKREYEKAGYRPVIVDDKVDDRTRYYLMSTSHHNHRAAPNIASQLQDPSFKQQGLELAYQLTKHNTLLKLSQGISFSQLSIPQLEGFNARQLRTDLVPPTGRTSINVHPSLSSTMRAPQTQTSETDSRWIAFLVFGIIGAFLYVSLRKKPQK